MFPENNLNNTIVYWGNPVNDGMGSFTFDTAVEIVGRWMEKTELLVDSNGKEIVSNTLVQVKQDVDEDGYMYLGVLTDLSTEQKADPKLVDAAYPIKKFMKTPTIKSNGYYREAFL